MKKILALILSILMLALPAFGGAEGSETQRSFLQKYAVQGQKITTDVSLVPGDQLPSMTGLKAEDLQTLLSALKLQLTAQGADSSFQCGLNLLLAGDEPAASLLVAVTEAGLLARSSLTGDDVFALSGEEIKTLVDQALRSMGDQGAQLQEQLNNLLSNPQEALGGLTGELDTTGLMTALAPILGGMTSEAVTEKPAAFQEAVTVTIIPLKKDDLTQVTTELAKLIWSIPSVQQMASAAQGEPLTEESLIQQLNALPAAMKEDAEIRIYQNADQSAYYVLGSMRLADGEEHKANISYQGRYSKEDSQISRSHRIQINEDFADRDPVYTGISIVTHKSERSGHANSLLDLDVEQYVAGDTQMQFGLMVDRSEDAADDGMSVESNTEIEIEMKPDASSDLMAFTVSSYSASQDLGDHAESTGAVHLGIRDAGILLTVNTASVTGPADAFLTDAQAVHPLSMSQEEQAELGQKVMQKVQTGLVSIMQQLPPEVLQIFGAPASGK